MCYSYIILQDQIRVFNLELCWHRPEMRGKIGWAIHSEATRIRDWTLSETAFLTCSITRENGGKNESVWTLPWLRECIACMSNYVLTVWEAEITHLAFNRNATWSIIICDQSVRRSDTSAHFSSILLWLLPYSLHQITFSDTVDVICNDTNIFIEYQLQHLIRNLM